MSMPVLDGISATRMIRAEPGDTQVIVMTGINAVPARRVGRAGVRGV
jgi:CheY-like chemotaxis protein